MPVKAKKTVKKKAAKKKAKPKTITRVIKTETGTTFKVEEPVDETGKGLATVDRIEFWRKRLWEKRYETILPDQDRVAVAASKACLKVLEEWDKRCTCPRTWLKEADKKKLFQKIGRAKLCQACKRMLAVTRLWVEIERISTARQKLDVTILHELVAQEGRREIEQIKAEARRNGKMIDAHPASDAFSVIKAINESGELSKPRMASVG